MRADNSRLTKKDNSFSTVKTIDGIRIPLTTTLSGYTPLSGSFIALKEGSTYDLYYADGTQWVKITDGGTVTIPPLDEVLISGNLTGGNDLVMSTGDSIIGETILSLASVDATNVNADIFSVTTTNVGASSVDINSAGGVDINSVGGVDVDTGGPIVLTSSANNITFEAPGGDVNTTADGQISLTSDKGQISLTTSQNSASAIRLLATGPNGGIDADTNGQIAFSTTAGTGTNDILLSTSGGAVGLTNSDLNFNTGDRFISTTSKASVDQSTNISNSVDTEDNRVGQIKMFGVVPPGTTSFTVLNTSVTDDSLIYLSNANPGGITGILMAHTIVNGTSFTITVYNPAIASTSSAPIINYMIVN